MWQSEKRALAHESAPVTGILVGRPGLPPDSVASAFCFLPHFDWLKAG